ncbi:MAG TPA: multidrug efflux RND transporter permease subunit [Myxococcales bacterium]|nr:multidrug efflux RND transporter permease subunit [Myxococcales bacterium]
MSLSAPFIRRPVGTSLLAAAVLLAGAAAYTQLPVAPLPRVDLPTINVNAGLPGASPETMAAAVATPLERRFGRIAGLTEMTSVSSLGSTSITLQFDLDRSADAAARDVQAAINAASGDLPANLPSRPNFRKVNPADAPILILSLTSQTLPLSQVFDTASSVLAQKLSQVPGVGQVFVGGGQNPAVRVQVDPQALAARGLGLEDVRAALAASTADTPKGSVEVGGADRAAVVQGNDQLLDAAGFRDVIVSYRGGAAVRLGDVARVFDDVENQRVAAWADGHRAVLLIVRRQPGANIIDVIERIKALLPTLAESISPAIRIEVALDRAGTIRSSVADVEITLVLAVLLVTLVVFAFLRSARATAIPTVAVPLSLLGTFGAMWLLGYSVNNLSLMALTISTGFVVDDAIVVTENIARLIEGGAPPLEAALRGARQIGFTIVSITASLLAVFIPILLMGGPVGRLFREFAVTLSVAIAMSALVSLTLTPMMCSRLLRERGEGRRSRWDRGAERAVALLQEGYARALRWVLRHRLVMGAVTMATVVITVSLYATVPKGLFPQQDTGFLTGATDAPQDISFQAMYERQQAVGEVVKQDPAVEHMTSFTGGGFGAAGVNTGTMFIALRPLKERRMSADQVIARLRASAAKVGGIQLFLQSVQDVRVGGRSARTQYQFTLQSPSLDELKQWAPRVLERLRKLPELKDVATDQQTSGLQLQVNVDRDTASRLGIRPSQVDDALYDAFGQRQVATFFTQRNPYRVVMEVLPEYQAGPSALDSISVRTSGGAQVPLRSIASPEVTAVPLSVAHQGQFPSVTLSFNLAPGVALGPAVDAIRRAEREIGMPASMRAEFVGTAQAFQASLQSEPMLILFALLTVYVVLGVLYESLIHPVTILSTLPSAGVGALCALLAFGAELSIIALIGIILLIGIVKKNAIMMIDFAIEAERDHGLTPEQSIYQACVLRFRPIMMTTLAALFGAVPLAVGGGIGSELRRPLGIAIMGGLLFSQALTLFTTPVIYLALDRFRRRPRHQLRPEAPAG